MRRLLAAAAVRLYALIIRAYPADFRERCGRPMLRTFEELAPHAPARRIAGELADAIRCIRSSRRGQVARTEVARDSRVRVVAQDARYAFRRLRSQPALTGFAVLTLGFAIAASASLFSIVDALLLRPSPFPDGEELVAVMGRSRNGMVVPGLSSLKLRQWREETSLFAAIEVYRETSVVITGNGEAEELPAAQVTPGLIGMLGVGPRLGRAFEDADARAGDAILVSERYWRSRLGGDSSAIGRTIQVNGRPRQIVGVMPRRFYFPTLREDMWLPMDIRSGTGNFARTMVRLQDGLSIETARARIETVRARLDQELPTPGGWEIALSSEPFASPDDKTTQSVLILLGAVGLVLLTAGANVANLLLTRAIDRHREFAIRIMLGAGRARLVRELLLEGLILGVVAGTLGLAAAYWSIDTLLKLAPRSLQFATTSAIEIDGRVILFGFTIAIAAGVLCNLPPAFRTMRAPGRDVASGRSRAASETPLQRRFRAVLVAGEVGLAVVLLAGAALMLRSFIALSSADIGFNPERVAAVSVGFDTGRYETEESRFNLLARAASEAKQIPGVEDAGFAASLPGESINAGLGWIETSKGPCITEPERVTANRVSPNYFSLLEIQLLSGRALRADDPGDTAVVSEALARRCGTRSLTGERVRFGPTSPWLTVVGTARNVKTLGLVIESDVALYLGPHAPGGILPMLAGMLERRVEPRRLIVRTDSASAVLPHVKRVLAEQDPDQPLLGADSAWAVLAETIKGERFMLALLALFSAVALALASAGIFGVLAYSVARRTSEIGVRVALGATKADVVRLVVGEGLAVALAGAAAGTATALAFARVLAGLLHGIEPRDPVVFIAIPLLVLGVALLASWLPTRRALGIDPASALRVD